MKRLRGRRGLSGNIIGLGPDDYRIPTSDEGGRKDNEGTSDEGGGGKKDGTSDEGGGKKKDGTSDGVGNPLENGGAKERKIPRAMLAHPIPNPLVDVETDDKGMVTLIYLKNFGTFERWLHKKIGGPENIRRSLDAPGSRMWSLFDGDHTIAEICQIMDHEFKEEMAPVFQKVRHFLEQLLILNLVFLESPKEEGEREEKDGGDGESMEEKDGGDGDTDGMEEDVGEEVRGEGEKESEEGENPEMGEGDVDNTGGVG